MKKLELDHVLRAAGRITGEKLDQTEVDEQQRARIRTQISRDFHAARDRGAQATPSSPTRSPT